MFEFSSLPVDAPLRITSGYGKRNTGIKGASTFHKGIDIGRDWHKPKTNILSVKAGAVKTVGFNAYRGWYIIIKHNEKYETLYQHLASMPTLYVGDRVSAGQILGVMGNSSDSKVLTVAVHLHFELHEYGNPIDPTSYLYNINKEITDMTENEIKKIVEDVVKTILKGNNTEVSAWAKELVNEAIKDGITDGSRPGGYATREEVAVMIERAKK